jgi:hypothetical protein
MSQLNVNVLAPLGYTGPTLPGNNNFVQLVDATGNTVFEIVGNIVNANGVQITNIGLNNIGLGTGNVQGITTGINNTAVGNGSGGGVTTGIQNTVVGAGSLFSTTTGSDNVAIGAGCLLSNTSGQKNIAIGTQALRLNTTTSNNVAIGHQAMKDSVGKIQSVAIGTQALQAGATGSVAVGDAAAANSTVTIVAVGNKALQSSTGASNTAVGTSAGFNNTTGNNNTFIGSGAAAGNTITGSKNTCLGAFTGGFIDTGDNNTCIGYGAQASQTGASDEFILGNANVAVLSCAQTSITSLSDGRDKKEIEELPVGLNFIQKLKPVKFVWDDRNENGKHNIKDFGFIAQDLKSTQEEEGVADYLKLVYEANPDKLQASYGKLIPVLVKAIQELSEEVKQLKSK